LLKPLEDGTRCSALGSIELCDVDLMLLDEDCGATNFVVKQP